MTRSISLKSISNSKGVSFLRAEWWDDASRFVLITYSVRGEEHKLRLDLDKMVFLDHSEDEAVEDVLREHLNSVWQTVVDERRPEFLRRLADARGA